MQLFSEQRFDGVEREVFQAMLGLEGRECEVSVKMASNLLG